MTGPGTKKKKTAKTEKRGYSYDTAFCQYPYIAGITPLTVTDPVNVPADGQALSVELNAGILYDQLGAEWPLQKFEITCDQ